MEGNNQYILSVIISLAALASLYIGVVVFRINKSLEYRWFSVLAVSSAIWAITNVLFAIVPASGRMAMALLSYGAAAILATGFLKFCMAVANVEIRERYDKMFVGVGLMVALLSAVPGFILIDVTVDLRLETYTPALVAYGVFLAGSLLVGVVLLVQGYTRSDRLDKQRIATMIGGLTIGAMVGAVFNLIFPLLGNYTLVQVGPLGVLIFITGSFYSIARHHMFDIRTSVVRTMSYTMSFTTLTLVYYGLAYVASRLIESLGGVAMTGLSSSVYVMLALILAFLFQPIKGIFDKITNRIFYRGKYDQDVFLHTFGKLISRDTDLAMLLSRVSDYVGKTLGADMVFFVIEGKGIMGRYSTKKVKMPESDIALIHQWFDGRKDADEVLVRNLAESEMNKVLHSHRLQLAIQLGTVNQALGYLFVGEHKGRGYALRDIRTLGMVNDELTIAVQNSLFVEEIRDLNSSLTQRVHEATKELRESNRQLRRLDEAKTEFVSMASHQLRTPLTSIKGYVDMVLQGDMGKVNSSQRKALSEAFASSERMVGLISDFLSVSRLQTGKFTINLATGDMKQIVREQVKMLRVIAKQHGLAIETDIGRNVPLMNIDADKLRQVVLNFIDNAIFYSQPGTKIYVSLAKEQQSVVCTVRDTGIGVPEAEKEQLFGRFFRAENARLRRPDGTGVGLFLARKIVLLHGGQIIFESEEGKGSTFGFRLPINRGG